jgi:tetratricopeptide (TPR) repeat protein
VDRESSRLSDAGSAVLHAGLTEPIGGFRWIVADVQASLGDVYRARGDLDQGEALYRKALATHEALGRKYETATDSASLGQVRQAHGDLARAEALDRKGLLLLQEMRAAPKITVVEGLLNRVSRQPEVLSPPKKP